MAKVYPQSKFSCPKARDVERALKRVKKTTGQAVGSWILATLRERLVREGLLPPAKSRQSQVQQAVQ